MSLVNKESLLPVRVSGQKRSKRLVTESEDVQLQSGLLEIEASDGDVHTYLQIKIWTEERQWSMAIFDMSHNLVALSGPRKREIDSWEDAVRVLKGKGLWSTEPVRRRSTPRAGR